MRKAEHINMRDKKNQIKQILCRGSCLSKLNTMYFGISDTKIQLFDQ